MRFEFGNQFLTYLFLLPIYRCNGAPSTRSRGHTWPWRGSYIIGGGVWFVLPTSAVERTKLESSPQGCLARLSAEYAFSFFEWGACIGCWGCSLPEWFILVYLFGEAVGSGVLSMPWVSLRRRFGRLMQSCLSFMSSFLPSLLVLVSYRSNTPHHRARFHAYHLPGSSAMVPLCT